MANKGASLIGGQFLGVNDMLVSPDGRFAACLQGDGNLVLCLDQDLSRPYWSIESDARSHLKRQPQGGQYIALMQGDGNFVLYEGSDPANRQPYWASDTNQSPTSFQLDLQNDGNLVVYRLEAGGAMTAVWDSGTWWAGGQVPNGSTLLQTNHWLAGNGWMISPNGKWAFGLQGDGNAVVYPTAATSPPTPDLGKPAWSIGSDANANYIGTFEGGKYYAIMQNDGNFVLYNGADPGHRGKPFWASNSSRSGTGDYVFYLGAAGSLKVGAGVVPTVQGDLLADFFPYRDWMTVTAPFIGDKPLNRLVIPATHDSGTYALVARSYSPDSPSLGDFLDVSGTTTVHWAQAQDLDIAAQLQAGIRFFDFRVADSPGSDTRPWQQRCRIVHSLYGPTLEDVLVPIAQFAAAHPQEIVFIYFSTIQDTEMNAASWAGLAAYVKGLFGTRLATTDLGAGATPNQMWARHQQVIAIWEDPTTADSTLWSKNIFLDKNWYGPDNPTTAGLKDTLQTWLETNDHTKFTLTACAIGATTNMVLEGQLNPLNSATSLKDIAQGVTPAAAGWVRDDWTQLLLNAVSCDFFELAPWVGTIVERNLTA